MMATISRREAGKRLGYNYLGETDGELTERLRQIGDASVVESRGNPPCVRTKKILPSWNGDGYCVEEGDDPEDGRIGENEEDPEGLDDDTSGYPEIEAEIDDAVYGNKEPDWESWDD